MKNNIIYDMFKNFFEKINKLFEELGRGDDFKVVL